MGSPPTSRLKEIKSSTVSLSTYTFGACFIRKDIRQLLNEVERRAALLNRYAGKLANSNSEFGREVT